MQHKSAPLNSDFQIIGGSIFLKLDQNAIEYLDLEHLKHEDTQNKTQAKIMMEINPDGEKYISAWNPKHPSQDQQ